MNQPERNQGGSFNLIYLFTVFHFSVFVCTLFYWLALMQCDFVASPALNGAFTVPGFVVIKVLTPLTHRDKVAAQY